jgi:hypothetical protein
MSAEPRMVSLEELAEWAVPNAAGEIAFFSRKRVDGQGYIHGPLSNGFIEPDGTFAAMSGAPRGGRTSSA